MDREVTLFITSCGRPYLLHRTLTSFVKHNTYPIKEAILCEDSGIPGLVDFCKNILPFPIKFCYNEKRIGQIKTIERYTPLITTSYVFHLEDDYEFFDSGFIELSFKILDSDKNISQVLLEDKQHSFYHVDINNPLCYKVLSAHPSHPECLSCFSWRPSLKRIEIQKLRMPYEPWDDEFTIQLQVNKLGYYSVITKNIKDGRKGFCSHIGINAPVPKTFQNVRIVARKDFPDKRHMTINDI